MNLRQLILATVLLQSLNVYAEANFRKEQACLADLREVSLPPSKNLTESIPVEYHEVIDTSGFEQDGRKVTLSANEEVIFSPAPGKREIFLVTKDMRYVCEIPATIGASARFLRFIFSGKSKSREYIELGISKDRTGRLEVSSQLKSGEVVDIVLGLLTTLGFGKVAAEVHEKMNGDVLQGIREIKCRESLDIAQVKADLHKAIADRIERLESHYESQVRDMTKSLQRLCISSNCDENPSLADRTELAHERNLEALQERILAVVKGCEPAVKDDQKLADLLVIIGAKFDSTASPSGLSAQGASQTSY